MTRPSKARASSETISEQGMPASALGRGAVTDTAKVAEQQ